MDYNFKQYWTISAEIKLNEYPCWLIKNFDIILFNFLFVLMEFNFLD